MIESIPNPVEVIYVLVGCVRARRYARWFYDDDDEIGVGMAWMVGPFLWPMADTILALQAGVKSVPKNIWKTIFIAGDPKPVRKARELEKRRARVLELERELDL